jgi:DNA-binding transcriptional ArsR family regulator/rhodanese-related sulfurtransferase
MADRPSKEALFAEFASVGKAFGNATRLELLDLLAQGPRSVEDLAQATDVRLSTCSAHLQRLLAAGLVATRRDGTRIWYSLAGDDVAALYADLREVARRHRPQVEPTRRHYLGVDDVGHVDLDELLARAEAGEVVVLDVRPAPEFAAGHLPGAVSIPLGELTSRLDELPPELEVVAYCRGAYCAMAHDAVRLLTAAGRRARRATDGVLEWRVREVTLTDGAA